MVFYCCVPNCTKTNRNMKIHRFPVDEKECRQWLMLIGRQDLQTMPLERVQRNCRVCDIHFRLIKKGSLPVLHMLADDFTDMQPHHKTLHVGEPPSNQGLNKLSQVQPVTAPTNILHPEPSHCSKRTLDEAFGEEIIAGPSHIAEPRVLGRKLIF